MILNAVHSMQCIGSRTYIGNIAIGSSIMQPIMGWPGYGVGADSNIRGRFSSCGWWPFEPKPKLPRRAMAMMVALAIVIIATVAKACQLMVHEDEALQCGEVCPTALRRNTIARNNIICIYIYMYIYIYISFSWAAAKMGCGSCQTLVWQPPNSGLAVATL